MESSVWTSSVPQREDCLFLLPCFVFGLKVAFYSLWWSIDKFTVFHIQTKIIKMCFHLVEDTNISMGRQRIQLFKTLYKPICVIFLYLLILILLYSTSNLQLCFQLWWLPECITTLTLLFTSPCFQVCHIAKGENA